MMKYTILLVLLQLCYSVGSDTNQNRNLNNEILQSLNNLTELCKGNKLNFTSPDTVVVPGKYSNASACVGVYSRELRNLLNNVTVHDDCKTIFQGLKIQLESRKPYQENDTCKTKLQKRNIKITLSLYKNFFRRLNNRR